MPLKTGDIVLFSERPPCGIFAVFDCLIRTFTGSKFSHAGIVVVDPPWTVAGTYVWDSSMHTAPGPASPKPRFGIQLVPIHQYLDHYKGSQTIYKRSPLSDKTYELFDKDCLLRIHDVVYGKHYDTNPVHWLAGLFHVLIPRTTNTFFCSAFVSYCLCQAGILHAETDWTIVSPACLSTKSNRLRWCQSYGPETPINDSDI